MAQRDNNGMHRRNFLTAMAGGIAACSLGAWSTGAHAANCITGNSGLLGASGTRRVFQNVNPPAANAYAVTQAYPDWPCTDIFNSGSNMNTSTWSGNAWLSVWANRAMTPNAAQPNPGNQKPNLIQSGGGFDGTANRVQYSTYEKANAATQSLIRYWLGMSTYADPWVAAGGRASDFVYFSQLVANPGAYFTGTANGYPVMTDIPWLPSTPTGTFGSFTRATAMAGHTAQVPGVVLDYEVQDGRSTRAAPAFLAAIYADVKAAGAKLFIRTNALDTLNTPGTESGLTAWNLAGVLQNTDYLSVLVWSGNWQGNVAESYLQQIEMLKGPTCTGSVDFTKLVIVFELGTTLNDAQFVNNLLTGAPAANPQAILFWPNGKTLGGACGTGANPENLMLATLEGSAGTGTVVAATAPARGWKLVCPAA